MRYLLLILFVITANGCIPPRPQVTLCAVDADAVIAEAFRLADLHANANYSDPEQVKKIKLEISQAIACQCSDGNGHKSKKSLHECDKHVAVSPSDFQASWNYLINLEKIAAKCQ